MRVKMAKNNFTDEEVTVLKKLVERMRGINSRLDEQERKEASLTGLIKYLFKEGKEHGNKRNLGKTEQ